jgi:hypothetical protein
MRGGLHPIISIELLKGSAIERGGVPSLPPVGWFSAVAAVCGG